MASVHRVRSKEGFRYRTRWRDPDGTLKSRSFAHKADANRFAVKVEHEMNVGDYIVGVWFGTYYETLLDHPTAAAFRLEGNRDDRPKRAVVLQLPWTVTRVDPGKGEDQLRSSDSDGL